MSPRRESTSSPCPRGIAVAVAGLLALAPSAARAAGAEAALRVQSVAGHDSNPLRLSSASRGAAFAELRLDAGAGLTVHPRLGFFVDGSALTRRHAGDADTADLTAWDLRAGLRLTPVRGSRHRLQLDAGGFLQGRRLTFTDRITGDPYLLVEDPAATPPLTRDIGKRLDADVAGAFLDARWRLGPRLTLFVDALLEAENYREDYEASAVLESLDSRRLTLTPGAEISLPGSTVLTISATRSELDYDQRTARTADGGPSAALSSYHYSTWQAALQFSPAPRWRAGAGLATTDRQDVHAGYYSYDDRGAYAWAGRAAGRNGRWLLFATRRELAYDRATVTSDPDGELRSSDVLRALGRYEHKLTGSLSLLAEAGTQSVDNPDPLFAYDRTWAQMGVKFKL